MASAANLASTEFDGGDGGPFDPRDVTIYVLETMLAEFRTVMRRLLDSEGEEAGAAIEAAEKLCDGWDQIDAEDEAERERDAHYASPTCDCGAWKGVGTSYCPVCDAETLARMSGAVPDNVTPLIRPF